MCGLRVGWVPHGDQRPQFYPQESWGEGEEIISKEENGSMEPLWEKGTQDQAKITMARVSRDGAAGGQAVAF